MNFSGPTTRVAFLLICICLGLGCHQYRWNKANVQANQLPPPESIAAIFAKYPDQTLRHRAESPGYDYQFDIGEKDSAYGDASGVFVFSNIELRLRDRMPAGMVIVDMKLTDHKGTILDIDNLDLMRLIPKLDATGDLRFPEMILEELNRFGVSFRKEHEEFELHTSQGFSQAQNSAANRAYRTSVTNNCLHPGKWEVSITSEDYEDFSERKKSGNTLNQNRILSHNWFQLDKELYETLLELKNPGKSYPADVNFDSISDLAEQVVIDYEQLRQPIRRNEKVQILEIGHKSNRKIAPVDVEEFYKRDFGLLLDRDTSLTYSSILDTTIRTAKFMDAGFYRPGTPRVFDFSWLRDLDSVAIDIIDVNGSETYVQVKLTGKWAWYEITLGNIDLALLDEQKLFGTLFGINTYPKSRRFNPVQPTLSFDADHCPEDRKPYLLLTEKKSGKWVNNQYKGIEKIYHSYESREKDVLEIYLLSYERITPVWMARVKLSNKMREWVRIKQSLYNY